MSWLGKILGFIFGFMILGPVGGLLGIFLGHMFDSNFSRSYAKANPFKFFGALNKTKKLYFYSLFSCIGHLSKVDGRVSEHEINTARDIMKRLRLNPEQTKAAMDAFNAGKSTNFDIHFYLKQLKEQSHGDKNLARMFMEFQIEAGYSDGDLSDREIQLLLSMAYTLGLNQSLKTFTKDLKLNLNLDNNLKRTALTGKRKVITQIIIIKTMHNQIVGFHYQAHILY